MGTPYPCSVEGCNSILAADECYDCGAWICADHAIAQMNGDRHWRCPECNRVYREELQAAHGQGEGEDAHD